MCYNNRLFGFPQLELAVVESTKKTENVSGFQLFLGRKSSEGSRVLERNPYGGKTLLYSEAFGLAQENRPPVIKCISKEQAPLLERIQDARARGFYSRNKTAPPIRFQTLGKRRDPRHLVAGLSPNS